MERCKDAPTLGSSASETQHCIQATLSDIFFPFQLQAAGTVGYIFSMVCNRNSSATRKASPVSSTQRGSTETKASGNSAQRAPAPAGVLQERNCLLSRWESLILYPQL